jgi:hypothetical protein
VNEKARRLGGMAHPRKCFVPPISLTTKEIFKTVLRVLILLTFSLDIRDKWVPVTTAWRVVRLRMDE